MTRVKHSVASRARRKRILKLASGYRNARGRLYRAAKEAVFKALMYAYDHRRNRKGDFRRLWIARIAAGVKLEGLNYSNFMHLLKQNSISLNRKVLADLATYHPDAFKQIVAQAKAS